MQSLGNLVSNPVDRAGSANAQVASGCPVVDVPAIVAFDPRVMTRFPASDLYHLPFS